jgi:hypothetical protein
MVEQGQDVDTDGPVTWAGPADDVRPAGGTLADQLLDGAGSGILAHDDQGVIRFVNATASALLPNLRVGELLVGALDPRRSICRRSRDVGAHAPCEVELTAGASRLHARRHVLSDGWAAWYVDDVTEQRGTTGHPARRTVPLPVPRLASGRLGLSLHPGRTARTVVELAVAELAQAVAVVWPSSTGADVVEWAAGERSGSVRSGRAGPGELPAPVVAALRGQETDAPLLPDHLADAPWADTAPWPAASTGPGRPGVSTAAVGAVVSLPGNGVPAGALVLVRDGAVRATATARDAALVDEFAQRAGIAMAAAALYARQVRTAGVLRTSLLQPSLPRVPGLTLGAAYRPADEGLLIGGDFYDVLYRPGTATTFLLGDVCGKGVDAAVSTGRVRQSVLALRRVEDDPVRLLELLNATMLDAAPPDRAPRFVTLVFGTATPLPGGGIRLVLAGGGHLPPLVVRGDRVEQVDIGGMLAGAVPDARFRARTVDLAPGAVVRALHRRGHRGARRRRRSAGLRERSASPPSSPDATCCRAGDRGPGRPARDAVAGQRPPRRHRRARRAGPHPRAPGRRAATCTRSRPPGHPPPRRTRAGHTSMSTPFPPRRFRDLCPAVGTRPGPVRGGRHRRLSRRARVRRRSARSRPGHRPRRRRLPRPGGAAAPRLARTGTRGAAVAVGWLERRAGACGDLWSPNASSPPSAPPRADARVAAATSCLPAWTGSGTRWPPASSERCCACTTGGSRSSERACRPVHLVSFLHQQGPDVVALSAALPTRLPAARHTVVAAQRTGTAGTGRGPGFGADGRFARRLGVDAWAPTAADGVALLDRLPWPEPSLSRARRTPARRPSTWGCGSGAGGW